MMENSDCGCDERRLNELEGLVELLKEEKNREERSTSPGWAILVSCTESASNTVVSWIRR